MAAKIALWGVRRGVAYNTDLSEGRPNKEVKRVVEDTNPARVAQRDPLLYEIAAAHSKRSLQTTSTCVGLETEDPQADDQRDSL